MIPIRDLNPTRRFPVATVGLIAVNVVVFVVFQLPVSGRAYEQMVMHWAVVPAQITQNFDGQAIIDIFRAMFMHGSWLHLLGNMLYLWIFGDNLEDRLGIPLYLGFYFASGIAATLAQVAIAPDSTIPMLGASGAIAGVLGGYLLLYPHARVQNLIFFFYLVQIVEMRAVWVLGFWFLLQVINGFISGGMLAGGGVAWFAHIGGFTTGLALIWFYKQLEPPARRAAFAALPARAPQQSRQRRPGTLGIGWGFDQSMRRGLGLDDRDNASAAPRRLPPSTARLGAPGSHGEEIPLWQEQQLLRQAHTLIQARRDEEAMVLLEQIPWNPVAREWLYDLYDRLL